MSIKQTEALKLALEALKDLRMLGMNMQWHDSWLAKSETAITAIREALAEQPAPFVLNGIDCSCGRKWRITNNTLTASEPEHQGPWKCGCGANLYVDENGNPHSKAEQPAQQQEPVACRDEMCACRGGPCASCPDGEREKELADVRASRDFHKRRTDELQKAQSQMRDPERTMVCDILANGRLLVPAGGRYSTSSPAQQQEYERANPLGGPAKVFDAMADAIRAGDDYHAVLRQYGFVEAQQQEPVAYASDVEFDDETEIIPAEQKGKLGTAGLRIPLYIDPPASKPWVGLVWGELPEDGHNHDFLRGAAWAESKLREKNA